MKKSRILAAIIALSLLLSMVTVMPVMASSGVLSGDIRWDFTTDSEGVTVDSASGTMSVVDGALKITNTNANPGNGAMIFLNNLNVDVSLYKYMRIRVKDTSASGGITVRAMPSSGINSMLTVSVAKSATVDTDFVEYVVNFDDAGIHPAGASRLSIYPKIRIDLMPWKANGVCYIDSIVLSQYETASMIEMVESVAINGENVVGFNPMSDYTEVEMNSTQLSNISEASVSVTFAEDYSDASYEVSVKEVTLGRIVDIEADDGVETRSYRIFCKSTDDYVGDIRWDFPNGLEGGYVENSTVMDTSNGVIKLQGTTADPHFILPECNIDLSEYEYIRVRMKNSCASVKMTAYLLHSNGSGGISYTNLLYLDKAVTANETEYKDYVFKISDFNGATRDSAYEILRLDYTNDASGGVVELDSIVLSKYEASNTTAMISEVYVNGISSIEGFDPASEYLQIDVEGDVYSTLTEESLTPMLASGYENAEMSISMKTLEKFKIYDISVMLDGTYRNYRIVYNNITASYPGDIRFDFADGAEGASVETGSGTCEASNGLLKVVRTHATASEGAHIFLENLEINPDVHRYVRIRMKDTSPSSGIVLRAISGRSYTNIAQVILNRDKTPDIEYEDYLLDLSTATIFGTKLQKYTTLRIDIMTWGGENAVSYIDSIVISKNAQPLDTEIVSSVSVNGVTASEFDSKVEYCDVAMSSVAYEAISEDNIAVTLAEAYSGAEVTVVVTNGITVKYVDILATTDADVRNYRLACYVADLNGYISDLVYNETDKTLSFDVNLKNNSNDIVLAAPIVSVFGNDGILKGIAMLDALSAEASNTAKVDVALNNYTYAEGDYIRVFYWDSVLGMKPVIPALNVYVQ